jgi:restriction endonuclease Mrr
MTGGAKVPSSIEMRWPALVTLDETPGPDAVLDVLDRVSARLGLSDEQRSIVSPDGSTPLVLSRLVEALGDLWIGGAVERTDSSEVSITDEGRRMTEEEVVSLAQASDAGEESNPKPNQKPSLWDYVRAFFESFPRATSSL